MVRSRGAFLLHAVLWTAVAGHGEGEIPHKAHATAKSKDTYKNLEDPPAWTGEAPHPSHPCWYLIGEAKYVRDTSPKCRDSPGAPGEPSHGWDQDGNTKGIHARFKGPAFTELVHYTSPEESEETCPSFCEKQKKLVSGNPCLKYPKKCGGCRICQGRDVPVQTCPAWCHKFPDTCYKFDECQKCPVGCREEGSASKTFQQIKALPSTCPAWCTASQFWLKHCTETVECQKCYKCFKNKFFFRTVSSSKEISEPHFTGGLVAMGDKRIKVKTPWGEILKLDVRSTDNVYHVKRLIQHKEGFSTDQQHLYIGKEEIHDRNILADYDVVDQMKMRLILDRGKQISIVVRRMNWPSSQLVYSTAEEQEEEMMKRMNWEDSGKAGEIQTLDVYTGDPILQVKRKIQRREGFPPEEQKLFFKDRYGHHELVDGNMLVKYDIKEGSKLFLVLHLKAHVNHATQPNLAKRFDEKTWIAENWHTKPGGPGDTGRVLQWV